MTSDAMKRVFSNNLNRIMYEKHKKQSDIVNTLGFKQPTVSAWMKGEKYPRMDKVQILAEYLGVKITDIVGDELIVPTRTETIVDIDALYKNMVDSIIKADSVILDGHQLSQEDVKKLKTMIDSCMVMAKSILIEK